MNEKDIISLILGEPEDDFHGTVPSKDKRLRFDRLRGHAGARHVEALPRRVRVPRRAQALPGTGLRLSVQRTSMIEIELDGKKVSVAEGSMVMHAADAAGT